MKPTPLYASVLVALTSSLPAHAWFRVACTAPLVSERVDPVISPNSNPSNHVHNRGDGDKSNGGPGLKAFPPGFKMLSGNPAARSQKYPRGEGSQGELRERAVFWSCLRYTTSNPGYDGWGFPTTDCEAGFNARIHMPACWDGVVSIPDSTVIKIVQQLNLQKNVDSTDHMSHVAYLSQMDNGVCPSTHPVYMMKLFYEVTWDVHAFASRWNPAVDKWPFVYSTGDPTGYSWHGDFQNGWDTTALQNAIDQCNNPNDETGQGVTEACSYLTVVDANVANQCKISPVINEQTDGSLSRLPGCNPIQAGPGDATLYSDSNCPF
ncbi:hypothetical protein C0995_000154 [Termitomyces sp. Mi166|nr:hypothetical protein C0995_000154 [Termitomyces sp. Mi166\